MCRSRRSWWWHDHRPDARRRDLRCPGAPIAGLPTLDLDALSAKLDELSALDVPERMAVYRVRRDRAEVMAVAAILFATLGEWLGVDTFVVPDAGVVDGVLGELAERAVRVASVA